MSIVICKLPKAGLGNQLFPLLKAYTFGSLNRLPVFVTDYSQVKIGPYLRKEKSKRSYRGYFKFEKSWIAEQLDKWKVKKYSAQLVPEPAIRVFNTDSAKTGYLFSEIPHWSDYFNGLKDHRDLVIRLFFELLSPAILAAADKQPPGYIGVHIRMGDFRKLRQGEDFSTVGAVRTPETYFIEVINQVRAVYGSALPVSVFTDGYRREFDELFSLPAVEMIEGNADIVDLLLLSRCKLIVCSAGSTFSYWAGFLSSAPLILHPDHIHQSIRPAALCKQLYEGPFSASDALLVKRIQDIPYLHAD